MFETTGARGALRRLTQSHQAQQHQQCPIVSPTLARKQDSSGGVSRKILAVWLPVAAVCAVGCTPSLADVRLTLLVDCPAESLAPQRDLVIVPTATRHEPRPALPPSLVAELTELGRTDDGCVYIVAPDGSARALSLTPRRRGEVELGTGREALRQKTLDEVLDHLANLTAHRPGADPVAAVNAAIRAHRRPARLVLLTNGAATVEPADLRRQDWSTSGPVLGAFLKAHDQLDLTGWDVTFVGLGEVAGAQPVFHEQARKQLQRFWLGVCSGAGAQRCRTIDGALERRPPIATQPVPVVTPPPPTTFVDKVVSSLGFTFALDSTELSWFADLALRTVVTRVEQHDLIITITGSADASTGDARHNRELSLRRAETVRTRLLQLGLPGDRIVAVDGIGATEQKLDQEQNDPSLIPRHRSVEITFSRRPAID